MPTNDVSKLSRTGRPPGTHSGHFKPRLNQLLQSLRLDVAYERGAGTSLFYRNEKADLVEVLDLVGGYGSLLFGHAHPILTAEAIRFLAEQRPHHVQGSVRPLAQRLASELSRRAGGDYYAVFANSGAEAVEAALKHAMLQTGHATFIALERGFHGKTLGALQLTANPEYREPFDLPRARVVRVTPNDMEALKSAFANERDLAGFVFEPVLGEGGVRLLDSNFVQTAARLCGERRIPLIADECQTGLGRTGRFLACEHHGVRPDYIVLSKALGGGLAKISALLVERRQYRDEFDLKHTSTYADDDYSCGIALKVLELLDEAALKQCLDRGNGFRQALRGLAERFPDVIADVRGIGLMLGLEFRPIATSAGMVLRFLSTQQDLLFVITGYLLHQHQIRVAPTLSDRFTLRFEPSLLLTEIEEARTLTALENVCQCLRAQDGASLTRFLGETPAASATHCVRSDGHFFAFEPAQFEKTRSTAGNRVGWICHLIEADDLRHLDPAFAAWNQQARETFLERGLGRAWPIAMNGVEIRSRTGEKVWLCPILLPFTSAWVKRELDAGRRHAAAHLVQRGVDLARELKCQLVALGQYTSIATQNGVRVNGNGMGVTTGNTYALWLALQAIARAERSQDRLPQDATLVIVGAAGNIGRAAAEILAPNYRETVLIGSNRPGSQRRLSELARGIPRSKVTDQLGDVQLGDTVLIAINAADVTLHPGQFKPGAVVCDLSVPNAMASGLDQPCQDLRVLRGGIASLPGGEDLGIVGFPLPPGQTYGCMAEAALLGFENVRDMSFTGAITGQGLRRVALMAQKHGFGLAAVNQDCILAPELRKERYAAV